MKRELQRQYWRKRNPTLCVLSFTEIWFSLWKNQIVEKGSLYFNWFKIFVKYLCDFFLNNWRFWISLFCFVCISYLTSRKFFFFGYCFFHNFSPKVFCCCFKGGDDNKSFFQINTSCKGSLIHVFFILTLTSIFFSFSQKYFHPVWFFDQLNLLGPFSSVMSVMLLWRWLWRWLWRLRRFLESKCDALAAKVRLELLRDVNQRGFPRRVLQK